jgi:hypothetical protein
MLGTALATALAAWLGLLDEGFLSALNNKESLSRFEPGGFVPNPNCCARAFGDGKGGRTRSMNRSISEYEAGAFNNVAGTAA